MRTHILKCAKCPEIEKTKIKQSKISRNNTIGSSSSVNTCPLLQSSTNPTTTNSEKPSSSKQKIEHFVDSMSMTENVC